MTLSASRVVERKGSIFALVDNEASGSNSAWSTAVSLEVRVLTIVDCMIESWEVSVFKLRERCGVHKVVESDATDR